MATRKAKRLPILLVVLAALVAALPFRRRIRRALSPVANKVKGRATVGDRLRQYGPAARARLRPHFEAAGVQYPPKALVIVGLKQEGMLEVWATAGDRAFTLIKRHPILGASGELGPKLREGDMQVPEGIYRIESLNPNSRFHLSMRLNYPNKFDLRHARAEGRQQPGSDIMIHGHNCSVGCLAMGDEPIEDLFVLAADTGIDNVKVVLAPVDFRTREMPTPGPTLPAWTEELYEAIRGELRCLKPHPRQDVRQD